MHLFAPVFLFLGLLPLLRAYDYGEILSLNASCSPKDTCSEPRDADDPDRHNCDCAPTCTLHGSCCIDFPFLDTERRGRRASCKPAGLSGDSVYMVDTCPPGYSGPEDVRRRCERIERDWSDPFGSVPVTHARTLVTYSSASCAACNGAARDLVVWQVMLDCTSLGDGGICAEDRDFVLNNMMYVREKGLWGLWSWDSKTDWQFRTLPVNYQRPPQLEGERVARCRPNLVSGCASNWRDEETEKLCGAYMGVVYFDSVGFRNVHCALCNGVADLSTMKCHNGTSTYRAPGTLSFGLLLDINLKDGNQVGNVDVPCGEEQVFDPFSKKCRTIECSLPGFILKDGKCVSE